MMKKKSSYKEINKWIKLAGRIGRKGESTLAWLKNVQEKCLFRFSAHFLLGLYVFFLILSCLYILEINPLSVASFAHIFSHSEGGFLFVCFLCSTKAFKFNQVFYYKPVTECVSVFVGREHQVFVFRSIQCVKCKFGGLSDLQKILLQICRQALT